MRSRTLRSKKLALRLTRKAKTALRAAAAAVRHHPHHHLHRHHRRQRRRRHSRHRPADHDGHRLRCPFALPSPPSRPPTLFQPIAQRAVQRTAFWSRQLPSRLYIPANKRRSEPCRRQTSPAYALLPYTRRMRMRGASTNTSISRPPPPTLCTYLCCSKMCGESSRREKCHRLSPS